MAATDPRLHRALTAVRESASLDFKEKFDPKENGEWAELVKDLVAIANSGGGAIVVGAKNGGHPSGADVSAVAALDPADITDKIARWTGENFADFEIHEIKRGGQDAVAILIGPARGAPLVFVKPGTYPVSPTKQKTAFGQGTVYFRHGAKSETASRQDLRDFVERELEDTRQGWLGGIRKVVEAPAGTEVAVLRRGVTGDGRRQTVQLTNDPDAPVFGQLDPDDTHPYRQKELVAQVQAKLGDIPFNSRDAQCIRAVHNISPGTAPQFMVERKYGSPQYSDALVNWIVDQCGKDKTFLQRARARYLARTGSPGRAAESVDSDRRASGDE